MVSTIINIFSKGLEYGSKALPYIQKAAPYIYKGWQFKNAASNLRTIYNKEKKSGTDYMDATLQAAFAAAQVADIGINNFSNSSANTKLAATVLAGGLDVSRTVSHIVANNKNKEFEFTQRNVFDVCAVALVRLAGSCSALSSHPDCTLISKETGAAIEDVACTINQTLDAIRKLSADPEPPIPQPIPSHPNPQPEVQAFHENAARAYNEQYDRANQQNLQRLMERVNNIAARVEVTHQQVRAEVAAANANRQARAQAAAENANQQAQPRTVVANANPQAPSRNRLLRILGTVFRCGKS